ncbi:MAG: transketolase [Candidatus Methylomirabilales bacterium]
MKVKDSPIDQLCINTIRTLAMDAVEHARSGHPGAPMGCAPLAYVLWTQFLRHNPRNPAWPDRDRFILSAGHASMLLYSLLHLTGYDLSLDAIKQFRQWESPCAGHPEYRQAPGIETTTGPLGQGFANAVGMAIAERFLAAHFNRPGHRIVDHTIYVLASDGDMMEGISHEAASLAGHLRLANLIVFYDANRITIEGETALAFSEDVGRRFEAYGWFVERLGDANDTVAIAEAIRAAQAEHDRPSLIIVPTHIAYGSPNKQDTADAHGSPLGAEEVRRTKEQLGWPPDRSFYIPEEARARFRQALDRGKEWEEEWSAAFQAYARAYPDLATEWVAVHGGKLPEGWAAKIPVFSPTEKPIATRSASGKVLNAIASTLPTLIGGSADLAPSTKTLIESSGDFAAGKYGERNLHFGVREHAMGGILSGLALHGGVRPYGATFFIFSDYMRPTIRLAAMMQLPVIYVFTHDSIGLGEDGPTHQPIEHLASLRAIPNLTVIRPADATETAVAWQVAIEATAGPVALILTRQNLPILDRTRYAPAEGLQRGAYVLAEAEGGAPDLLLIATGSEVHLALATREKLQEEVAVRVVSMPSWELFERQPEAYRQAVLPPAVTARLAIEAASPFGWERYIGPTGQVIGLERFGASAPYTVIFKELGFTVQNVAARARKLLGR